MKKSINLVLLIALLLISHTLLSQRTDNNSRSWQINTLDWGIESGYDEGSTQSQIILDGENDTGGSILLQAGDGPLGAGNITLNYPDNGNILFQQNGTALMTLTNSSIGIGNSNPEHTLDITGDINITGNILQNNELLDLSGSWNQDNDDIYFNSGNVGIGTDDPQADVHIARDGFAKILLHNTSAAYDASRVRMGYNGSEIGPNVYAGGLLVQNSNDYGASWSNSLSIQYNGRVGIGTDNPKADLHIARDGFANILLHNTSASYDASRVRMGYYGSEIGPNVFAGGLLIQNSNNYGASWSNSLYVNYNGRVGIGTVAPSAKLDVDGDINYSGNLYQNGELVDLDAGWNESNGNLYRSSGNLGIGFSNPYGRLHVKDHIALHGDGLDGSAYQLAMFYANESLGLYFDAPLNASNERLPIQFNWRGGGTPPLYISGNGNVGIGTDEPHGHKLAVAGDIITEEIWVIPENNWQYADFVFKDEYKLKSLSEVESFIEENGHLPDVPNEAEVKETGINLHKMDVILLQKIEELTLYVIEQNKTIEKLVKENELLQSKE